MIFFYIFFVEIASKLKTVDPTFSSVNPFPCLPSVAKTNKKQNKRHNVVLNSKPRSLFLEFS